MGQYTQAALLGTALGFTGSQGRAKPTLKPRKYTLNLPTLIIGLLRKAFLHLPAIWSCRCSFLITSIVDRYDRRADTKYFPTELVMPFTIVSWIGQQLIDSKATYRLLDCWCKIRRVITRSYTNHCGSDQMAGVMTNNSQFGPITVTLGTFTLTHQIVPANILRIQAGGIYGSFGILLD